MSSEPRSRDARVEQTLAASEIGVLEWHPETRQLLANGAARQLFGDTRADPEDRQYVEFTRVVETAIVPVDRDGFHRALQESLSSGRPVRHGFQARIRGRDRRLVARCLYHADAGTVICIVADVTSRDASAEELRASEERHRLVFERNPVPLFILNAVTGHFMMVNRAGGALLGLPPDVLRNQHPADFVVADDLPILSKALSGERGQIVSVPRIRFKRAGGEVRTAEGAVERTTIGAAEVIIASAIDITQQVLVDEARRETAQRLEYAMDATADGIWDWNVQTGDVVMNARWARMLGYEPEELPASITAWRLLAHPEDAPVAIGLLEAHARGERPQVEFEMRMKRKDGSWCWILNRSKIVERNPDGSMRRVVGTHTDISASRDARERAEQQATLLDSVLSNIPIAIDIVRPDGFIEYLNRAGARILGWSLEEMRQTDVMSLMYPDPEYRKKVFAAIAAGSPEWGDWTVRTRDGRDIVMSWSNVRLADGRAIGMGLDVTAQRRADAERTALEQQMQQSQKLESLGVLAGGIAHDFNNLLVGVLGNATLAEEVLDADSPAAPLIADVRAAATRAADLTRQLLAYAGKGRFVIERVHVSQLVHEMAALLRAGVSKRAVFTEHLAPSLPPVEVDVTQLRQIVMNLITNASDALGDGGGTITLRTSLRRPSESERRIGTGAASLDGPFVCIEVSDTGHGMDEATLARIFEPFFTTKVTGRGLGLAATLGIIRSHRGVISVESAPGAGTTMRIYFPPADPVANPTPITGVRAIRPLTGSGTVLLADDEAAVRTVLRRALERAGFEVVTAADGREAIERFGTEPARWRCVILDLTMPHVPGGDALLAMRAMRPDVPAVLCSGYAAEELDARVAALEQVRFLQKPFTVIALTSTLADLMAGAQPSTT